MWLRERKGNVISRGTVCGTEERLALSGRNDEGGGWIEHERYRRREGGMMRPLRTATRVDLIGRRFIAGWQTLLGTVLGVLVAACSALAKPSHETLVLDSGITLPGTIGRHGIKDIYWLDNTKLLFLAKEPNWVSPAGEGRELLSLMLWDLEAGKPLRLRGPGIDGLCVGDDLVRYYRRRIDIGKYDELERYAGRFGEEKVVPTVPIDRESCRPQAELPPLPDWAKGRRITRLRPEHGFLEWSSLPEGGYLAVVPVKLYRYGASESQGIALAPALTQQTSPLVEYFPNERAYLLITDQPDGPPIPLRRQRGFAQKTKVQHWWLSPEGTVTLGLTVHAVNVSYAESTLTFPGGKRITFPTMMGSITPFGERYLVSGDDAGSGDYLKRSGLYVVDRSGVALIAKGLTTKVSISPDGCRAAFGLDDSDPMVSPHRYRLHVIDQCKGDSK